MHCLIVDTQADRLDDSMISFLDAGLQVMGTSSLRVAETCLRRSMADVLLIDQCASDPGHIQLVRMAEMRNPRLVTLMITPNVARDSEALTRAYPSVHCVLGDDVDPRLAAKLALASLAEKTVMSGLEIKPFRTRVQSMAAPVFHSARAEACAA